MRLLLTASLALALGLAAHTSRAALPPGISGAWYNKLQPGHGLTVQVLEGQRVLVFWHVFGLLGDPLHLYIEGDITGQSIHGEAYMGSGMRFGSFDPADHTLSHWGSIGLDFTDCNTATLRWEADGEAGVGFGSGSMPLSRLTGIAGLACNLDSRDPDLLPTGLYRGSAQPAGQAGSTTLFAAVDRSGVLWATRDITPTDAFVGLPLYHVVHGTPTGSPWTVELAFHANYALAQTFHRPPVRSVPVTFSMTADGGAIGEGTITDVEIGEFSFEQLNATDFPLQRPFDPIDLQGAAFTFTGRQQFFELEGRVRFTGHGTFCIDTAFVDCRVQGTIGSVEPGLAMFSFTAVGDDHLYTGKGWLEAVQGSLTERLVLVATSDTEGEPGLGLVGTRE